MSVEQPTTAVILEQTGLPNSTEQAPGIFWQLPTSITEGLYVRNDEAFSEYMRQVTNIVPSDSDKPLPRDVHVLVAALTHSGIATGVGIYRTRMHLQLANQDPQAWRKQIAPVLYPALGTVLMKRLTSNPQLRVDRINPKSQRHTRFTIRPNHS